MDPDELSARGVVDGAETSPELRYLTDAPRILRRIFWLKSATHTQRAPLWTL